MSKDHSQPTFYHRSLQDRETIVEYLDALGKGLKYQRLFFSSGDEEIVLKPRGLLNFSVKVKRKEGDVQLTVRISWKEKIEGEGDDVPLIIHGGNGDTD